MKITQIQGNEEQAKYWKIITNAPKGEKKKKQTMQSLVISPSSQHQWNPTFCLGFTQQGDTGWCAPSHHIFSPCSFQEENWERNVTEKSSSGVEPLMFSRRVLKVEVKKGNCPVLRRWLQSHDSTKRRLSRKHKTTFVPMHFKSYYRQEHVFYFICLQQRNAELKTLLLSISSAVF